MRYFFERLGVVLMVLGLIGFVVAVCAYVWIKCGLLLSIPATVLCLGVIVFLVNETFF